MDRGGRRQGFGPGAGGGGSCSVACRQAGAAESYLSLNFPPADGATPPPLPADFKASITDPLRWVLRRNRASPLHPCQACQPMPSASVGHAQPTTTPPQLVTAGMLEGDEGLADAQAAARLAVAGLCAGLPPADAAPEAARDGMQRLLAMLRELKQWERLDQLAAGPCAPL